MAYATDAAVTTIELSRFLDTHSLGSRLLRRARGIAEAGREAADQTKHATENCIRRFPAAALVTAAVAGSVVALLVRRR